MRVGRVIDRKDCGIQEGGERGALHSAPKQKIGIFHGWIGKHKAKAILIEHRPEAINLREPNMQFGESEWHPKLSLGSQFAFYEL